MWEISECLFLEPDLHYVTRQTEQTAPMCEIHDLSHSDEACWKDRGALFKGLTTYSLIISHHEYRNNLQFWIVKNPEGVFQVCQSPSDGLVCQKANFKRKPIHPGHVPESSLSLTDSYKSLTLKGSIMIQTNFTPTPCVEKRKEEDGVHVPHWTLLLP